MLDLDLTVIPCLRSVVAEKGRVRECSPGSTYLGLHTYFGAMRLLSTTALSPRKGESAVFVLTGLLSVQFPK